MIDAALDPLCGERITQLCERSLGAEVPRLRILEEVDSTSSEAMRWRTELANDRQAVAVVAEQQSAGRGRRGRSWNTAPGSAVHLSLARPLDSAYNIAPLGLACAIAVHEVLAILGVADLAIKWPNDIVCTDAGSRPYAKLGGLLLEASQRGGVSDEGSGHELVVGLGLNLSLPAALRAELEAGTEYAVGDLAALGFDPSGRNELIAMLIVALAGTLERFQEEGFPTFRARWDAVDMLRGLGVAVRGGDGRLRRGVAHGIDAEGALRVRLEGAQELLRVHAGEVSVRPLP
ncbi:MAG: biotin--[acetyl-CoA-carboxylase] ligase [Pseudomonadota bacterium]